MAYVALVVLILICFGLGFIAGDCWGFACGQRSTNRIWCDVLSRNKDT